MTTASSQRSSQVASFKVMDVLQRANALQAAGHNVLHCEVGQPETGAPQAVQQAAVAALQHPTDNLGYTNAFGLSALREKVAQHYLDKYKVEIPMERVVITTGSSGGFLLAFTACFDVGDVVAIASSGYPCYRNILQALGCQLVHVPLNDDFQLTATELTKALKTHPNIKGLILSSPSNPTGAMLSPAQLQELCAVCDQHNIQFLSDEIYHGISYGSQIEATAIQYSDKAVVLNSFSKYYSSTFVLVLLCLSSVVSFFSLTYPLTYYNIYTVSGWRLGWMILPEHLIDAVNKLQQNMFINAPTLSQTAALQCWNPETIQELEQHVQKYHTSREIILTALGQLTGKLHWAPADGGFYVYIDLLDHLALPELDSTALCSMLLEEHHVAFTPGIDFEDPSTDLGHRRFRISYAGGVETVRQAMERFQQFWPNWLERVEQAKQNNA